MMKKDTSAEDEVRSTTLLVYQWVKVSNNIEARGSIEQHAYPRPH